MAGAVEAFKRSGVSIGRQRFGKPEADDGFDVTIKCAGAALKRRLAALFEFVEVRHVLLQQRRSAGDRRMAVQHRFGL